MRDLIVDYIPFEISAKQINESIKENDGKLVVKGVLQRANAKNQNGRVYPMEILQREAKNYNDGFIKQKRALGELDHPDSSVVNLQNVSHNVTPQGWSTTITSIMRIDMNTLLKDTRVEPQEEKSKLKEFKSLDYVLASLKLQNMKKAENDDVEDATADEDSPGPGTQ